MNHDSLDPDPLHGLDPQKLAQGALDENAPDPNLAPEGLRERLAELLPDFDIGECLGRGGMGAVFRAQQRKLDRTVAIKVLLPAPNEAVAWQERFEREARALALLSHPNIISVFDFGQAEELCYLITEYVDGVNLRTLLREGKLEPEEALAIVPQLCDALHCAHEQGVVHRDIKPENVLIGLDGNVKVADFGLAKLTGGNASLVHLTLSSQAMGTLRYMAPEQLDSPRDVDHRADIYSLGVVFYEMLTGEIPAGNFQAPSKKVRVDVRLDEVVLKAMQSEPLRRYQHVSEVKSSVEKIESAPRTRAKTGKGGKRGAPPKNGVRARRAMAKAIWRRADGTAWFVPLVVLAGAIVLVAPGTLASNPGYANLDYGGSMFPTNMNLPIALGSGALLWHRMGRSTTRAALITRIVACLVILLSYELWFDGFTPEYRLDDFGDVLCFVHIVLLVTLQIISLARLLQQSLSATLVSRVPIALFGASARSAADRLRRWSIGVSLLALLSIFFPYGYTMVLADTGFLTPTPAGQFTRQVVFGWDTPHAIATATLFLLAALFRIALIRLAISRRTVESAVSIIASLGVLWITGDWLFKYAGPTSGNLLSLCAGGVVLLLGLIELVLPESKLDQQSPS
ncbi:MAG: putative Ser/Thr protein kinase [Planctomycetota bacterium]|jgi:predicted Ser/Thr protein kinase